MIELKLTKNISTQRAYIVKAWFETTISPGDIIISDISLLLVKDKTGKVISKITRSELDKFDRIDVVLEKDKSKLIIKPLK